MKDKLNQSISELKQVLDTLPTNTIQNRKTKTRVIAEEINTRTIELNKIKSELEKRKQQMESFTINPEIESSEKEMESCKIMNEWNTYNTPLEKLHLDYYLYLLHHYYKDNLSSVNEWILKIITSFKQVGIVITENDFNYNIYAKEYINSLLNSTDQSEIKTKFDEIYWKFPELLSVVEMNIRSIYLSNEKKITKYYQDRLEEYLKAHKKEELENLYKELYSKKQVLLKTDSSTILQNFVSKKWDVRDYTESNALKKQEKFFKEKPSISLIQSIEQTLLEYSLILEYEPLLEDMKKKLTEKDSYKGKKSSLLKEIANLEKKLIKLEAQKNTPKKGLFKSKSRDDKLLFKYKDTLNELSKKYEELEEESFNDIIYRELSLDTSILNIFKFITSNYLYFISRSKEIDDSVSISTLNEKYKELQEIIDSHNFIFLDHIALLDEQNIKMVIADKCKLESVNITMDDLEKDNVETIRSEMEFLENWYYINTTNLSVSEISSYLDLLQMFK